MRASIMRTSIPTAVLVLTLSGSLAACSDDKAEVCDSVDELKSSVDEVKGIDVTSASALADVQDGLGDVQDDLDDVKQDAESEFSDQIDAVEAGFTNLESSVENAQAAPSAEAFGSVGSALSGFATDTQTLVADVQDTC